jgi:hypothetical protein
VAKKIYMSIYEESVMNKEYLNFPLKSLLNSYLGRYIDEGYKRGYTAKDHIIYIFFISLQAAL